MSGSPGDDDGAVTRPPWKPRPEKHEFHIGDVPTCGRFVSWWDGEYEGFCLLDDSHDGDHFDGSVWFDDDGEDTSAQHVEDFPRGADWDGEGREVDLGEAVAFAMAFHDARREEARRLSFRTRVGESTGVVRSTLNDRFPAWSFLSDDDQRISIRAARNLLAAYRRGDENEEES